MREFKFKIWDNENKTWDNNNEYAVTQDGELIEIKQVFYNDYNYKGFKYIVNKIICFCTGLEDCKRNVIYEGDIIFNTNIQKKGLIIFECNDWYIRYDSHISRLVSDLDDIKICGNIYENSELLEG